MDSSHILNSAIQPTDIFSLQMEIESLVVFASRHSSGTEAGLYLPYLLYLCTLHCRLPVSPAVLLNLYLLTVNTLKCRGWRRGGGVAAPREHISPVLASCHWLSVHFWIGWLILKFYCWLTNPGMDRILGICLTSCSLMHPLDLLNKIIFLTQYENYLVLML